MTALEGCGGTAKSTTPPRLLSDHDMMSFIRDGFLMLPLDELRRSPGQVRLGGQDRSVSAKQVQISYCAQSNLHTNLKSGPRKQARIIAEKEALKEELDGIKQQNVELQVRPTFQISM